MFKLQARVTLNDKEMIYTASPNETGVNEVINAFGCTDEEYDNDVRVEIINANGLNFSNVMIEDLDAIQLVMEEEGIASEDSLNTLFGGRSGLTTSDFEDFRDNHHKIKGLDKEEAIFSDLSQECDFDLDDLPSHIYGAIDFEKVAESYQEEYNVLHSTNNGYEFIICRKDY